MKYPFAIALWLLSSAATAYESKLPPPEYDHPYPGPVKEIFAEDMETFNKLCPIRAPDGYLNLACTRPPYHDTTCWIYYAPKQLLELHGVNIERLRRHEMGHCNGWHHEVPNLRNPPDPFSSDKNNKPGEARVIFPK